MDFHAKTQDDDGSSRLNKHKHKPVWHTVRLAETSLGYAILDVWCECGISGSFVIEANEINWDEDSPE